MDSIKRIVVGVIILSTTIFALTAILAIWNVVASDIAYKSISTIGVILFASIIALVVVKILDKKEHLPPTA